MALSLAVLAGFSLVALSVAVTPAEAQTRPPRPAIPSSAMPGREREQFLDKFPPPKTRTPPVITVYDARKPKPKKKRRVH